MMIGNMLAVLGTVLIILSIISYGRLDAYYTHKTPLISRLPYRYKLAKGSKLPSLAVIRVTTAATKTVALQSSSRGDSSGSIFDKADDDDENDDEKQLFKSIALQYLENKFRDCRDDDCRMFINRLEASELLKSILPPITASELDQEINRIVNRLNANTDTSSATDDDINMDDFIAVTIENTYWRSAGELVVKELIFLDCLHNYYYENRSMLDDEYYKELKEMLTWEGSSVASLQGKEAHFITAVASNLRGMSLIDDASYDALKAQLQSDQSWVVTRAPDPLEKLGIQTFLGYLHRSL